MTSKALRWGILSTAHINNALIPPLRSSKRNKLMAVASRTKEKAQAYALEKKIKIAYGSYEALLADPEIDVIYNPLPNHLHAEWTIKALEAGKHVLCEKPIALSMEEMDGMIAAAKKNDRLLVEAFAYRSHPHMQKVKELVRSGKLGEVKMVHGSFSYSIQGQDNVRLDPTMGGGSMWDIGCYPMSFARCALEAEPLEVFGWQVSSPSGVDETFAGQLRFPGDIYFQLDCSFRVPIHEYMEIVGSEGTLSIPQPFNNGLPKHIYLTRSGKTTSIVVKGPNPYTGEVESMADAILLGKPALVSLADSRGNTAAILALLELARLGQPVVL